MLITYKVKVSRKGFYMHSCNINQDIQRMSQDENYFSVQI